MSQLQHDLRSIWQNMETVSAITQCIEQHIRNIERFICKDESTCEKSIMKRKGGNLFTASSKKHCPNKVDKLYRQVVDFIKRIESKNKNYTKEEIANNKELNQFPHLKDKFIKWKPTSIVTVKNFERVKNRNKKFYEYLHSIDGLTLDDCIWLIVSKAEGEMPMPTQKYSGLLWFKNMLGAMGQNNSIRRLWW